MTPTIFQFDEKAIRLIDELKESTHAFSRTQVLRKALYLLDIASKAHEKKGKLIIQDADGNTKQITLY